MVIYSVPGKEKGPYIIPGAEGGQKRLLCKSESQGWLSFAFSSLNFSSIREIKQKHCSSKPREQPVRILR